MRLVTVVCARPQFIKAAVVSRVLRRHGDCAEILVHTGQHYDANMSQVFFDELEMAPPHVHLGIGSGAQGVQTGRMLEAVEGVLAAEAPDAVLIYGDTNSTLAGALAAAKLHIPVAHVEAGLRSFNRRMPEEINRVVADHVSTWLFAPTRTAVDNLAREGIAGRQVHLVGDVMYDAALYYAGKAAARSGIAGSLDLQPKRYVLATIHRAENTDEPCRLDAILAGLVQLAQDVPVVLPLHPRTRGAIERQGWGESRLAALKVIAPVGYLDMVCLEKNAGVIVTDSGGVQKEAYFHGVPCVTLRDETEWVELIELGVNRLCPPLSAAAIVRAIRESLQGGFPQGVPAGFYGAGKAAERIAEVLTNSENCPRGGELP